MEHIRTTTIRRPGTTFQVETFRCQDGEVDTTEPFKQLSVEASDQDQRSYDRSRYVAEALRGCGICPVRQRQEFTAAVIEMMALHV
jgi:hypothetical protein